MPPHPVGGRDPDNRVAAAVEVVAAGRDLDARTTSESAGDDPQRGETLRSDGAWPGVRLESNSCHVPHADCRTLGPIYARQES